MAEPLAGFEELLTQATCAVTLGGQVKGTAWLLDDRRLLSAGHILGKTGTVDEVEVQFLDDPTLRKAKRVDFQYNHDEGIDCCVLELTEAMVGRKPLPVSLPKTVRGTFHIYGFGKTLVDPSSGTGTFVGPYDLQKRTANRLFQLETQQAREQGYSGGAIFSEDLRSVVAIQIEGTTVPGGAAHGTTVLAMPMYRIAKLFPTIPVFRDAIERVSEDSYWFHVYLSYDRGGPEELWLDQFFLNELTKWLRVELGLSEDPSIFSDHNANRDAWDLKVAEAIRRSCCLVPVLSPSYWRSPKCLAELETFKARQVSENVALTLGVVFHEMGREPAGGALTLKDFMDYAYTYKGFQESASYKGFQEAVKTFVSELAGLIRNAPEYENSWPVVPPAVVTPAASTTRVRISRPQL